jgi:hypothetical protein
VTARKPRESAPLPFRLLRLAYEEARANALENVGGLSTLRDEWAKSLRDVVSYDRGQRAKATRGRKAAVMRPPHDVLLETARELGARLCGLKVAHAGRTMILEIAPEGGALSPRSTSRSSTPKRAARSRGSRARARRPPRRSTPARLRPTASRRGRRDVL